MGWTDFMYLSGPKTGYLGKMWEGWNFDIVGVLVVLGLLLLVGLVYYMTSRN